MLRRSSRGRPENVLGTSRINVPGASPERQIRTSLDVISGRPQDVRLGRPRHRIFRGRPGDVGEKRPRDVLGTNICRLGNWLTFQLKTKVDDLDVAKLKTAPVDLKKISDVVDNQVGKKTKFITLKTKVNNLDLRAPDATNGFVTRITKISEVKNKIPDTSSLVATTALNTNI